MVLQEPSSPRPARSRPTTGSTQNGEPCTACAAPCCRTLPHRCHSLCSVLHLTARSRDEQQGFQWCEDVPGVACMPPPLTFELMVHHVVVVLGLMLSLGIMCCVSSAVSAGGSRSGSAAATPHSCSDQLGPQGRPGAAGPPQCCHWLRAVL